MFDRLEAIEKKYDELNELMSDNTSLTPHELQKYPGPNPHCPIQ
jgi:hypothetical protein